MKSSLPNETSQTLNSNWSAAQLASLKRFETLRSDSPILQQKINGKPLVYLDNGATTHKPQKVIDTISQYYRQENATVRRGLYYLSELSTHRFEEARQEVARFLCQDVTLNAEEPSEDLLSEMCQEIIFTKGCTESINLVAQSYGNQFLQAGDEILISEMEHHANLLPWQLICKAKGAKLKVINITPAGEVLLDKLEQSITSKTKLLAITHVSNVLGTINPVKEIIALAHSKNVPVLLDGAQAAPHMPVNVKELDCDFYAFSSHKIYGPTGVGVLYGKKRWLEAMPPYQAGGDMIESVSFEESTFAPPPYKFEAGTPAIAQVFGFQEALKYVRGIGLDNIAAQEALLLDYATEQLQQIPALEIYGQATNKASLVSFNIKGLHPLDLATVLDQEHNICIRVGHHCCQPLMKLYGVSAMARASFAFYNTLEEIDLLVKGLLKAKDLLS